MKKIICLLIILALLASVFCAAVFADEQNATTVYDPASYDTEEGRKTQTTMLMCAAALAAVIVGAVIYINYRQSK